MRAHTCRERTEYYMSVLHRVLAAHICAHLTSWKQCQLRLSTLTHPCEWQTAGHFLRLSQVWSHVCSLHCVPLGVRVQMAEGEEEVGDLGVEGPCDSLEEVLVGVGSPGPRAQRHYVALEDVHPVENQRLSGLMGLEGRGQEVVG